MSYLSINIFCVNSFSPAIFLTAEKVTHTILSYYSFCTLTDAACELS